MAQEQYKDWIDYYAHKGLSGGDLKTISGYDHSQAQLTERGFGHLISTAAEMLQLRKGDKLLDVGCGAGLITTELSGHVTDVIGIDANREMIQHVPQNVERVVSLAQNIPLRNQSVDKIFCHSIFQYFADLDVAENAISEFLRVLKKPGSCLIMDIPDLAKREDYLQVKTPDTHNLQRLFYNRSWFLQRVPGATITDHNISDYGNSRFRFDILISQ